MRTLSAALMIVVCQSANAANPEESDTKHYLKHTYGPTAIAKSAASAGVAQIQNTPSEWHQGVAGFGRRFASAFGFHIVKKSIEFPVAHFLHEQYGYHPSEKTGAKARLMYAVTSVVITHKVRTGEATINGGELAGDFGAGFISRLWQPASTRTIGAGLTSAGTTLAIDAAYNVVREFWPEIRHPHSHSAVPARSLKKEEAPAIPEDVEIAEQDREEE